MISKSGVRVKFRQQLRAGRFYSTRNQCDVASPSASEKPVSHAIRRGLLQRSTAKRQARRSLRADALLRLELCVVVGMGPGGGERMGHQQRVLYSQKHGRLLIHFGTSHIHGHRDGRHCRQDFRLAWIHNLLKADRPRLNLSASSSALLACLVAISYATRFVCVMVPFSKCSSCRCAWSYTTLLSCVIRTVPGAIYFAAGTLTRNAKYFRLAACFYPVYIALHCCLHSRARDINISFDPGFNVGEAAC